MGALEALYPCVGALTLLGDLFWAFLRPPAHILVHVGGLARRVRASGAFVPLPLVGYLLVLVWARSRRFIALWLLFLVYNSLRCLIVDFVFVFKIGY